MTDVERIERYIAELAGELAAVGLRGRDEIVAEIRALLEHRATQSRLGEALESFGDPAHYARHLAEELQLQQAYTRGGPRRVFAALAAVAPRRITAAAGLLVAGFFCLLALGFVLALFAELFAPERAGLWVDSSGRLVAFGFVSRSATSDATEVLGRWNILVSAALALLAYLGAQRLGRYFIGLMLRTGP